MNWIANFMWMFVGYGLACTIIGIMAGLVISYGRTQVKNHEQIKESNDEEPDQQYSGEDTFQDYMERYPSDAKVPVREEASGYDNRYAQPLVPESVRLP